MMFKHYIKASRSLLRASPCFLSSTRVSLRNPPLLRMTRAGALIGNLDLHNLNYIQLGMSDDLRNIT